MTSEPSWRNLQSVYAHEIYCVFIVTFITSRWEKAAAPHSKRWAPSSTSQRLTPFVPCRPGKTPALLVTSGVKARSHALCPLCPVQHGRLQAGEIERSHQTSGHCHHLHRSVHKSLSALNLGIKISFYPVFFKHSVFFRSGQVSMRDSYYVKLSVRQTGSCPHPRTRCS